MLVSTSSEAEAYGAHSEYRYDAESSSYASHGDEAMVRTETEVMAVEVRCTSDAIVSSYLSYVVYSGSVSYSRR